jgi:glycosyltransferase involved in cell wall biosynthesis
MKRLLFLITGLDYGGAEIQVTRLIKTLQADYQYEIKLVVMITPQAFIEELTNLGVEVISLNMKRGRAALGAIIKLKRIIRGFNPDVVHAHMVHANLLSRVARLVCKIPLLINTIHSVEEIWGVRKFVYRITDFMVDLTTTISARTGADLTKNGVAPKTKLKVVYNGLDVQRVAFTKAGREKVRNELGIVNERFVWISIGRFEAAKDHQNLIKAFKYLVESGLEQTLLLVGEGTLKVDILAMVQALELEGQVRFLGRRDDIAELLSAADGYVLASLWEGLPLVLQEAAAVGLPIVATDVGGNGEIVRHGKNGYLAPKAAPRLLAEAMQKLMQDAQSRRTEYVNYSRRLAGECFDIHKISTNWVELYQNFKR